MTCPIKGCPQPGHTAGRWRVDGVVIVDVDDEWLADSALRSDAALIAAAPEMAHALAELVRYTREGEDVLPSVLKQAQAALAKARGE